MFENSNDENITITEKEKIRLIQQKLDTQIQSRSTPLDFSFLRLLGLFNKVTITNISGKDAWIILSSTPIWSIKSFSIDKVGSIEFQSQGDIKSQQSPLSNNSGRDFNVEKSEIYYSVFFKVDEKWKHHFQDRKIKVSKYNINLLERHVDESVDFIPIK